MLVESGASSDRRGSKVTRQYASPFDPLACQTLNDHFKVVCVCCPEHTLDHLTLDIATGSGINTDLYGSSRFQNKYTRRFQSLNGHRGTTQNNTAAHHGHAIQLQAIELL